LLRYLLQNLASLIGTLAIFGAPLGIIAFIAFAGQDFIGSFKDQTTLLFLTSFSKIGLISFFAVVLVGLVSVYLFKFSRMLQRTADKMEDAFIGENRGSSNWLGDGGEELEQPPEEAHGVFRKPPKLHSAWEDFGKTKEQLDNEEVERRRRVNRSLAPYVSGDSKPGKKDDS